MLNWLVPIILIAGKFCSLSPVIPHQVHTKIEAVSVQDSLALVALYDSTNGPRWDKTWDKSKPVSTWHGVTVNLGNVTSVKLIRNKLKGRLPSQLGNLSKLKELTIVGDSIDFISGQIPESLWNINTLEVINFKFNKLTGFLSKSIAKLRLLDFAEFSYNSFEGTIPAEIGQLTQLRFLYLAGNRFIDTIPSTLAALSKLIQFSVEGNQLTGKMPAFFGDFKSLNLLHLHRNNFSGTIPAEYGNMTRLEECYLGLNSNVTGTIPSTFGNLTKLKILGLNDMNLSGTIPPSFGNLPALEVLYLNNNKNLGGAIPDELGNLTTLKEIDLSNCQFMGPVPASFSRLNLVQFSICNNDLTSLPIMNGVNIKTLCISRNQFTFDDLMAAFKSLPLSVKPNYRPQDSIYVDTIISKKEGETLTIDLKIDSTITGNVYKWYKGPNNTQPWKTIPETNKLVFSALKPSDAGVYRVEVTNSFAPDLTLQSRKITIQVRPRVDTSSCRYKDSLELIKLYDATNGSSWKNKWDLSMPMNKWYGVRLNDNGCVTCLDLDGDDNCNAVSLKGGNFLKGQIPPINLPELQYLFLRDNELSGPLPNFVLPKLESLVASNNKLTESIPNLNLPKLRILWLNDNQFTGPIPNFNLKSLVSLVLTNNMLSDTIPNFNLPMLVYLRLSSNKLSGTIPKFSMLPNLLDLWLGNNELSGIIPAFSNQKLQTLILSRNKFQDISPSFNLPQLSYLNLEQNQLKGIADYSKLPLSKDTIGEERGLRIMNNQLTFKDVIPNLIHAQKATFIYAPQARVIILDSIRNVLAGQTHIINLGIDESLPQDSPNTYFWEKDGKPFDTLIGVNRLAFPRLKMSDAGWYTFRVINPKAPQLTLYGNKIRINVNCPPNANAIAISSSHASLCLGDTLKLSIDKKLYTNIRWNNGQTTPEIAPKLTQSTTFSLTANDTLGCTNTGSRSIDVFNKPKLTLFQVTENCSDRLEPEIDGGSSPYRYTWSNSSNASTINLTTLGSYSLTVTDANNCKVTDMILVANLSKRFILKDSLRIMPSCNQADGTIWFTVSPKNQVYTYEWTPATTGQGQNPRTQLSPGQYKVLVRNSLGCIDSLTFNLQGSDCNDELRIFPAFTPNGDWVNETFEIRPINCPQRTLAECFPNNELIILDRSNHAIYQKSPYNNDWDGENYPVGSYYYIFYPDRNKQKNRMTGWLTLLR